MMTTRKSKTGSAKEKTKKNARPAVDGNKPAKKDGTSKMAKAKKEKKEKKTKTAKPSAGNGSAAGKPADAKKAMAGNHAGEVPKKEDSSALTVKKTGGRRLTMLKRNQNIVISSTETDSLEEKKAKPKPEEKAVLPSGKSAEKKPVKPEKTPPEKKKTVRIEDLPVVDQKDKPRPEPGTRKKEFGRPKAAPKKTAGERRAEKRHIPSKETAKEPAKKEETTLPAREAAQTPSREAAGEKVERQLPKLPVSATLTVRELAEKLGVKPVELIKKLMNLGVFATINQRLENDAAQLIAAEYGWELEIMPMYGEDMEVKEEDPADRPENLVPRPPIITIMGHVDHGKTTLLDTIRESDVVASEAGQITQHIGAYMVSTSKGSITFLDTPGHEAFTAMRAHGAKITDMVILVVSAADGVQPQTMEAINHAKAANVPIIVAVNKIDLPNANSQKVLQELAQHNLVPEGWGGKTLVVEISAKKKINIDKLLDMILLQSEVMEIKGNPKKKGRAVIVESKLDTKRGNAATIIAVDGIIKTGDPFVVGAAHGKIRAMSDDAGRKIESISPGHPAEILGITGLLPQAGDILRVMESEKEARRVAEKRKQIYRQDAFSHQKHVSLLSLKSDIEKRDLKNFNVIVKADVYGSMQAIKDSLEKLSDSEINVRIIHSGIGNVAESDLLLAKASDAVILGFHVNADSKIKEQSQKGGIQVMLYDVIYDLIEDVKSAMSGLLEPEIIETVTGRAQILKVFNLSSGKIAGCQVREGRIARNQEIRLLRDGAEVGRGRISGLRRFKEDVKQVDKGIECGMLMEGARDFREGDVIEAVAKEEKMRRLNNA